MFPWLSRNLILPLHERLLGRRTFPLLGELQGTVLTQERLAEIQRERLKSLFQHCRQNIPWWRSRLSDAPEGDEITDPRAALSGVPILKRSEIRGSLEEMRWRNPPVKVIKHTSSGTTDDNLLFYCGRERQTWNRAMRQ
ncbi:MAG: hypothetical protein NT069_30095, partial [Planctomycetota bacterium]|nr:hypothetical protein [Planctomycetota bacterium]